MGQPLALTQSRASKASAVPRAAEAAPAVAAAAQEAAAGALAEIVGNAGCCCPRTAPTVASSRTRPPLSSRATLIPARPSSSASVMPATPPPTMQTSDSITAPERNRFVSSSMDDLCGCMSSHERRTALSLFLFGIATDASGLTAPAGTALVRRGKADRQAPGSSVDFAAGVHLRGHLATGGCRRRLHRRPVSPLASYG